MVIDHKIKDEKLQYDISREVVKILALSSGKIDKYEFLTKEEILSSEQSRKIEQTTFTNSSLGRAFEKQIKTIKEQGWNQLSFKSLKTRRNSRTRNNWRIFSKKNITN